MNHPNKQTLGLDFSSIVHEATNAYLFALREEERAMHASERMIPLKDDDREEPSHAK